MYDTLRRNISQLTLHILPLDMCVQAVMLALLTICSPTCATLAFATLLGGLLYYLSSRGTLALHKPSMAYLWLHLVLFYLLSWWYTSASALELQMLWLGLLVILCVYDRLWGRHARYKRAEEDQCCCSLLRGEVLAEEYRHFEQILMYFASCVLVIGSLLLWLDAPNLVLSLSAWLVTLVALATLGLELCHLGWVQSRLLNDYWIPIVDDAQRPIGRVSSTAPYTSQGRLPLVRLIAFSQEMIYLEQADCAGAARYDTPFDTWLQEGQTPLQAAQQMIDRRFCGIRRARPRQLLHYHTTSDQGQALSVYLMIVDLEAPDLLQIDCRPIEGKWWCLQQTSFSLAQSSFSPYLRLELPYLEQTALLAQELRARAKE